ncbi:MAG: hypothetical protein ACXWM7_07590 [Parachlamydiaceae bacterium]
MIYALSTTVFESECRLVDAAVITRKTNIKIILLGLNSAGPFKQARIAELQEKIRQRMGEIQSQEKNSLGISLEALSNEYLLLVKQVAMLKVLQATGHISQDLRNMTPEQFSAKKEEQYAQRKGNISYTVLQSSMDIISTGIKIAALGTNIGNIYVGTQAMSLLFGAETELVYKIIAEKVKLLGY